MIKIKKILFVFIATLVLVSCGDNFLNVDSREQVEEADREETYTPTEFVTGIYGSFTDWPYAFSWLGITEIISDNANKGSISTDTGVDKRRLDNFTFTSASVSVGAMWTKWYKTIGRATYAIEYIKSFEGGDQ